MSGTAIGCICAVYLTVIFLDFYISLVIRPPWQDSWDFCFGAFYTVGSFLIAAGDLSRHNYFGAFLFSIYTLWGAWHWWHNDRHKRRRKKLLDRAAGRVADMGGRLKVIRPTNDGKTVAEQAI